MTISVHDHIHIGTDNPPTTTYYVQLEGYDETPDVAVAYERGLTGLLHVHRVEDSVTAGKPVQFDQDSFTVILRGTTGLTDKDTLKALAGRRVYYVRNYHDDDENGAGSLEVWGTSLYVKRGILLVSPSSIKSLDPSQSYWTMGVTFLDDDKVTS